MDKNSWLFTSNGTEFVNFSTENETITLLQANSNDIMIFKFKDLSVWSKIKKFFGIKLKEYECGKWVSQSEIEEPELNEFMKSRFLKRS